MRITSILSEYLKAADLQGREAAVVISQVKFEKMDGKDRAVLFFLGKTKGLMLNKTNINNIVALYGDETNDWNGKEIVLFPAWVDYQGKSVEAIRVKGPQRSAPQRRPEPEYREDPISSGPIDPPRRAIGGVSDNMQMNDDNIPF
jgi:hypothetical protein